MPLDWDECEKLHGELNVLFDARIKERVEESVQRFLPLVDEMLKAHIEQRLRAPTSFVDPAVGGELSKWVEREAKSAADHHIRLFGGCQALREIVGRLWDAGAERYIQAEVDRRLRDAMQRIQAALPTPK